MSIVTRFRFNPTSVKTITNVTYQEDHQFMKKNGLSFKTPSEDAVLLRCAYCESWWGCGPEVTGFLINPEEEISIEKGKHRSCPLLGDTEEKPIMNLYLRCRGDKRRRIIGLEHNKKVYQLRQLMHLMGFAPAQTNGVFQRSDGIILHDGLCFESQGLTMEKSCIVITVTPNPKYAESERYLKRIQLSKINDLFPLSLMDAQTDRPLTKSSEHLVQVLTETMQKTRDSDVTTPAQKRFARQTLEHIDEQISERRRSHPVRQPVHIGTSLLALPHVDHCPASSTDNVTTPEVTLTLKRSPFRRFLSGIFPCL